VPLGEMETFYRSIDVLIAPSIWPESFGLVTREALSAGVWVIAADSGALAEPVQDGINGNVIAPRDVRALAESLRHAASAEGREALHRWREDALSGKGLATPPDNAENLHRIYSMAARAS
jgi:glycosyltransferase involved in cell wall biosynthesis